MKTSIILPDELLTRVKATAAIRRTSLNTMIEHALKRELEFPDDKVSQIEIYELNEHGLPVLKKKDTNKSVSSTDVYQIMEELGV
jgi:predicted transcriptional regulator